MTRPRSIALLLLYLFTAVSIAGYASFGRHPEWLASQGPAAITIYAVSFRFFAIGQVILAGVTMISFLIRHARWKWVTAFIALYSISLACELLGTTFGIPFGAYSYSAALNPMWLSRVPLGIPLSWFYMAVPSYAFALLLVPKAATLRRITLGSFILLAWDLALDPAMSSATKYWEWAEQGSYYGMPLLNLFGWYVTGVLLMGALALLRAESWISRLPVRWLAGFYGVNLLLALGISISAGLWLSLVLTVAAFSITIVVASIFSGRHDPIASLDPAGHALR
ncbi:MAG TPA: carotenoid biosynthesis protein [Gemmatimonadaceae bacterium]|nr:carotenoid biosynthesis protein [Gemmatimonadaceae bacterium]